MTDGARAHGMMMRMRPLPGQEQAVEAHLTGWHRSVGRETPGTRLHLLLDEVDGGQTVALHLFESTAAYQRCAASALHKEWEAQLAELLSTPPEVRPVAVRWNAAAATRPRVAVSIDRDVHATVQDLIGRLLERHPRTAAEDLYLNMLQSIAEDYERDYPAMQPDEGDLR